MAHLNQDDFARLQNQLLDLKEKNYGLEDVLRKHKKELTETRSRLHGLEEENVRYQSLIRTSKKAGEMELLVRDNGYLRNKLKDQEEDFRLQNNTLLKELSKLVSENEQYERQMKVLCSNQGCGDVAEGDYGSTDDSKEVIRLRGELKDIHNKLFEAEARLETESQTHMEKVTALTLHITQLTNILQLHSIPLDEGEISLGKGGGVTFKKLTLQDDDGLETDLERTNATLQQSEDSKCSQLQRETETLQTQLKEQKELTATLTTNNTKLEESLAAAADNRALVEELRVSLANTETQLSESNSRLAAKSEECDTALESTRQLKGKLETVEATLQEHRDALIRTQKECQVLQDRVDAASKELSETAKQSRDMKEEMDGLQTKMKDQNQELTTINTSLASQTKLAETRLGLIEEMKAHMQEEKQRHQNELDQRSASHKEEIASLSSQNQTLQNEAEEMRGKISEMTLVNTKVVQLEEEKVKLQECNAQLQQDVKAAHRQAQEDVDRITAEKYQEIEKLKCDYNKENADLQTQLEISTIQRQEAEDTVEALRRKVADGEEEQKIHERKGVTLMKDLKKQLMAERKRADRLQEKLSQLLTDPAQLMALTSVSDAGDDVSSVSSWSLVSGEPRDSSTRENSIIASPQGSPPPGPVTEETMSLVNRVTELQQHKWQLEERITHLESSSSAMADDLLKKSAIIQHFCMEHKNSEGTASPPVSPVHPSPLGEKLKVRRVLEMVRGGAGEESLREINRRLQNLLEETLGKNMQLHKDVDNLSQQVHDLSKLAAVKTTTTMMMSDLPPPVDVYHEGEAVDDMDAALS